MKRFIKQLLNFVHEMNFSLFFSSSLCVLVLLIVTGCANPYLTPAGIPPSEPLKPGSITASGSTHTIPPVPRVIASITPSPARTSTPTHTSTFDPAALITVTRSPAARCPEIDDVYQPELPENDENREVFFDKILDALNRGASLAKLKLAVAKVDTEYGSRTGPIQLPANTILSRDLTGDGIPETIFYEPMTGFVIYTCKNGQYEAALALPAGIGRQVVDLLFDDLNRDGIPEVVFRIQSDPLHGAYYLYIYEWDGQSDFHNLIILNKEDWIDRDFRGALESGMCSKITTWDNGSKRPKDIIIREIYCGSMESLYSGPFRWSSHVLTWNGVGFQSFVEQLDPPIYRFQAVQDGDQATWRGDYRQAMNFYQQALEDSKLKGWSAALYRQQLVVSQADMNKTPTPTPAPTDPNEFALLSAYTHYRILLLHAADGRNDLALADFMEMKKTQISDQLGYDYFLLAEVFWNRYADSHDLGSACSAARAYAKDHADAIYEPIDFRWHGWQSPEYDQNPLIICPFD